jgi:beta-N-acetylhexosaminidase
MSFRSTILLLCIALVACGGARAAFAAAQNAADKADIRGRVTNQTAAGEEARKKGVLGTLLIEGAKEKDTGYDKAYVRVTAKTKVEKLDGKERKPARFEDLKKGARVQAVFTGPVAESYPVQATAAAVLILEEAK